MAPVAGEADVERLHTRSRVAAGTTVAGGAVVRESASVELQKASKYPGS